MTSNSQVLRDESLTKEVKNAVLAMGLDLVGVADPSDLDGSPDGHPSPFRILPGARSIVSIVMRAPHGAVETPHPPIDGPIEELEVIHGGVYFASYMAMNLKLMEHAYNIANYLEKMGYKSAPVSSTLGRDEQRWVGPISLRRAAQQAGLGEIGLNSLLITPEFGPRVRLAAVITTAPLVIDGPKLVGKVCTKCGECIKHCPTKAVHDDLADFERKRCIWGAMGLYKGSGGQMPPQEWLESEGIPKMMGLVPKYKEMYPQVQFYRDLSVKYMGYPNCLECYLHCSVGKEASRKKFGN